MDVVNKSRGKLELFNMVDLISLKAGRNRVAVISTIFLVNEEGKLASRKDGCKLRRNCE